MENTMKHKCYKLLNNDRINKYISKPTFKNIKSINDNLHLVEMQKESVTLNKPIIGGFAILDLSKYLMFEFYYSYI